MDLQARARRSLWSLRLLQSAGAAVVLGGLFALTAAAEGLAPLPLGVLGALLAVTLVLLAAPPWIAPDRAVDPSADADGLLRTALSPTLDTERAEVLAQRVAARPMKFRGLPEWQAWAVFGLLCAAVSGWTLLEPEQGAANLRRGSLDPQGMALDGSARHRPTAPDDPSVSGLAPPTPREAPGEDGVDSPERGEWQRVPEAADGTSVRLGLDLGLEQGVYERYLRNLAKRP